MNKYQEYYNALQDIIQLLEEDFIVHNDRGYDYDDDAEYIMEEGIKEFEYLKDAMTLNGRIRCMECRAREVVKFLKEFLKEIQDDCYNEEE